MQSNDDGRMQVRLNDPDGSIVRDMLSALAFADAKFPGQSIPDGTGEPTSRMAADYARILTNIAAKKGELTWNKVLTEEFLEALAETDPEALSRELDQIVAVAIRWRRDIIMRSGYPYVTAETPLYGLGEVYRRVLAGLPTATDKWDGKPGLWFDKSKGVPCAMQNEIHEAHGDCPGIPDPGLPYNCGRYGCLGHGTPGPHVECGNGGDEHEFPAADFEGNGVSILTPDQVADLVGPIEDEPREVAESPVVITREDAQWACVAIGQFMGRIKNQTKRSSYKSVLRRFQAAMDDPFTLDAPVEITEAGVEALRQASKPLDTHKLGAYIAAHIGILFDRVSDDDSLPADKRYQPIPAHKLAGRITTAAEQYASADEKE